MSRPTPVPGPILSYSLRPGQRHYTAQEQEASIVNLTARIKEAADGRIAVTIDELPETIVHAPVLDEIPDVVKAAAAQILQQPEGGFDVQIIF